MNLIPHAGYSRPFVFLEGIMDTTDFAKTLLLYNSIYNINNSVSADIVYPTKGVQKYDLRTAYNGNDSTQVTVYSYGNTLTADHPLYSSPDSAVRHPLRVFNSLHSRKLQSLAISALTPVYLYLFTTPGFNYADFMTYDCDPAQYQARRIAGYTYLGRRF